ncbi:MAG TPA: NADPH-dependent FMN reductase [Bacteroidia bacterium]|jgi:NAD(P)H-dependent FMN reductase|nr:NADPH-dependent FMN reductase [Bacteroidia bacterium]
MPDKKKILAISGSTREKSSNSNLIQWIINTYSQLDFTIYKDLANLPHFNVDLDIAQAPAAVVELRKALAEADGVLICTPEYAMGVPGSLKNLLDWTVSTGDFSHRPTVVITASTSGEKAHESLLGTLRVIEAKIEDTATLLISHIKAKVNANPEITDEHTKEAIKKVMETCIRMLNEA